MAKKSGRARGKGTGAALTKSILIVEDNADTRRALVSLLGQLGYAVIPVATVTESMERLDGQDFAILDLNLPDGLGTTVLQRIREEKRPIRVAIVTASQGKLLEEAERLKPEILLRKPIDVNTLLQWLEGPA